MRILVTGCTGFIASNLCHYWLEKHKEDHIIGVDSLTEGSNLDNLLGLPRQRFDLCIGDLCSEMLVDSLLSGLGKYGKFDAVIHAAALTHVDYSIANPIETIKNNVLSTSNILYYSHFYEINNIVNFSTDESFSTPPGEEFIGRYGELSPLAPNNPYSASKAAGELIARSFFKTFELNVKTIRPSNNFGPRQDSSKLLPKVILAALNNQDIPIYTPGTQQRDWLYVEDTCKAVDLILHSGKPGEVYNAAGGNERTNLEIVKCILNYLGKSKNLIKLVPDRLGHDVRYMVDSTKIQTELRWEPSKDFEVNLNNTIEWYAKIWKTELKI